MPLGLIYLIAALALTLAGAAWFGARTYRERERERERRRHAARRERIDLFERGLGQPPPCQQRRRSSGGSRHM